ncbi:MAG TPA: hypothetical protein QF753_11820 [Victivallales bacterium]|nr:hypothetical protein [Victivallales bacterium]
MKAGDEVNCPHCNQDVFLVKKTIMDGWTKVGEILVCSMCNKKISDLVLKDEKNRKEQKNSSIDKLASFLKTEQEEKSELKKENKYFCRDCTHFVSHPFLDRCSYFDKNINPMDDCSNFQKKEENN